MTDATQSMTMLQLPIRLDKAFPQQLSIIIDKVGYILYWRWLEGAYENTLITPTPCFHLTIKRINDTKIMFNGLIHEDARHFILLPNSKYLWAYLRAYKANKISADIRLMTQSMYPNPV